MYTKVNYTKKKKEDVVEDYSDKFIRICESAWHKPIILKSHERCPLCNSTALHLSIEKNKVFKDE